jgi:hypothetical protein
LGKVENEQKVKAKKISEISMLSDFIVEENGIRAYKFYKVGPGKFIPSKDLQQYPVKFVMEKFVMEMPFWVLNKRKPVTKKKAAENRVPEVEKIFVCPEEQCSLSFETISDLEDHLEIGDHIKRAPERLVDKATRIYAQRLEDMRAEVKHQKTDPFSTMLAQVARHASVNLGCDGKQTPTIEEGFALPKHKKGSRHPLHVRNFLQELFAQGQRNKCKKVDGPKAIELMKKARNPDGSRTFLPSEILTATQIKSYFGQLAKTEKEKAEKAREEKENAEEDIIAQKTHQNAIEDVEPEDQGDAYFDEYIEEEQVECLNSAINDVMQEISNPNNQIFLPDSYSNHPQSAKRFRRHRHNENQHTVHKHHKKHAAHSRGHRLLEKLLHVSNDYDE